MSGKATSAARAGWLILPVTLAGLVHVVVLKADILRSLAYPIDGRLQWRSRPVLGAHKTWRGVLLMTACTSVFTQLQSLVGRHKADQVLGVSRDYRLSPWLAGGIMGLSYCLAELPNSFVKRQLGVLPGARAHRAPLVQYTIDQIDSVLGCLIALRLYYRPRAGETVLAFVLGSSIHVGVDCLLYVIGVKRHNR